MYSDRRGYGQNPPPDKTFQTKDPRTKAPDKKPGEQLRENLYRGLLSGSFVLGLLKMGRSEMYDVFSGVPRCVTKCDRWRGENWPKIALRTLWTAPWPIYLSQIFLIICMRQ